MFPDFFVAQIQLIAARNTTLKLVNEITIENCGGNVSGDYNPDSDMDGDFGIDGTCIYYKHIYPFGGVLLKKNEVGDWTISEDLADGDVVPLFICKGSRCATLPPKTGWERTDGRIDGPSRLPVISYYHKSSSVRTEIDI